MLVRGVLLSLQSFLRLNSYVHVRQDLGTLATHPFRRSTILLLDPITQCRDLR
jgi:hypothetical protein